MGAGGSGGPSAGWYADPAGSGGLRYWDGNGWTEHVTPVAAPTGPFSAPISTQPVSLQPVTAPGRPGPRVWPWFALIGVLFLIGVATAAVMLIPRAVRAGGRVTDLAAQVTARDGLDAAQTLRSIEGSYANVRPDTLANLEPDITFTDQASTDFQTASVSSSSQEFAIAVLSLSGRCYVIIETNGVETTGRMQDDRPCLAALAFGGIVPEKF